MARNAIDSDSDRELDLDRDSSREPRAFSFPSRRPALTGRGTLRELLLERTEPEATAPALDKAWRPGDQS